MIKLRPIQMDLNRSFDFNQEQNYQRDKAWVENINHFFIPDKNYIWGDIEIGLHDNPDYYLAMGSIYDYRDNQGNKNNYFDESKAILIHVEPYALRSRFPNYDNNNFSDNFLKVCNFLPLWWGIGRDHNELLNMPIEKTKNLSAVLAASTGTEGHLKRLSFLKNYLSQIDNFDHYGNEYGKNGFFSNDPIYSKHYRGQLPCKGDGMLPYFYHYNCENTSEKDYLTEKIFEAILSETLCFYSGAPNLNDFINPDAYIGLDLDDPEKSFDIVKTSIANSEWEKRIDIIKQEKLKILNELNIMNVAWLAIHGEKGFWEK